MICVHLVTGFLGTGKTTLLERHLASLDDARGVGVIVNEAGETAFDGLVLQQAVGDGSMIQLMPNGCLCCRAGDDLAQAVRALSVQHQLRHGSEIREVFIETSGLARPGPLVRQLGTIEGLMLRIKVIATVDATLRASPSDYPELAAQWAGAGTLVLTRADLADDGGRAAAIMASSLNPIARLVDEPQIALRATLGFDPEIAVRSPQCEQIGEAATSDAGVFTLSQQYTGPWTAVSEWFDNVAALAGDRLLRLKALVRTDDAGHPWLVQSVGSAFARPSRIATEIPGHAVVIATGLTLDDLHAVEPVRLFACSDECR